MSIAPEIPEGKAWKYAHSEWERSFLLEGPPPDLAQLPYKDIEDRYLKNSHIRLRKTFDGENTHYKLSKKLKLATPSQHWVSTLYLNETEYQLFSQLEAFSLKKRRYYIKKINENTLGIDHIILADRELWLAEIEFSSAEAAEAYQLPIPFIEEVGENSDYSGFALARIFSS